MSGTFFVTTPIYYINAEPHIGHTYTTVVADTLARHHRQLGDDTFFLTGVDEHGEKALEVATKRGEAPAETAAHFARVFVETWDAVGIEYDRFIRTSDPDHEALVRSILQQVYDSGQIEFREYEGDYCVGCERFLTDRDLVDGLCPDHERKPERRSESNYFFKMSEHFAWLADHIREHPDFIQPERYANEVLGMLREDSGLGDLCISRPRERLDWGIELPFDRDYVCYVWFDALINYLTGAGFPDGPEREARWGSSLHLIGKDILKPHAIFWPTMLRAIGLPPVQRLRIHGYWNVDDRKVSKSLGNMISPLLMQERYGFEPFRYYLLREMVFGQDANFSEAAMVTRVNADLANNLGNLVSRTLNMTGRFTEGVVPEPGATGPLEAEVEAAAEAACRSTLAHFERLELHRAVEAALGVVDAANRYYEQREPWRAAKDPARAEELRTTLWVGCEALRIAALLLWPAIPAKAEEIHRRLGLSGSPRDARLPDDARWGGIAAGGATTKGAPLFPRLELPEDAEPSD